MVEGLVSQIMTGQTEAAVMFSTAEDKHLKLLMDMEECWDERKVAARVENRKHEERTMQMMLAMHQAPLAMQMHHLQPLLKAQPASLPVPQQYSAASQEVVPHITRVSSRLASHSSHSCSSPNSSFY